MSYILDALRKADQQRQRGAAPTLLMGQLTETRPTQPAYFLYGLLATALLGAGLAIGWLRPWQAVPPAEVVAARSADARPQRPVPAPAEIATAPMSEVPLQAGTPVARAAPAPPSIGAVAAPAAAPTVTSTSSANAGAEVPGGPHQDQGMVTAKATLPPELSRGAAAADFVPAQNVLSLAELPLALRQELPPLTISVHAYSGTPGDRLVGINHRMLREGDALAPGLKLEQITPEGMVFSYKGYRFRRGLR